MICLNLMKNGSIFHFSRNLISSSSHSTFIYANKTYKNNFGSSFNFNEEEKSFVSLGLNQKLVDALKSIEITNPTPIQEHAIPKILMRKKDVVMSAQTGTGKTLAYLLPVIHNLKLTEESRETRLRRPKVLVISPNRELTLQITRVCKSLGHFAKIRVLSLVGARSKKEQGLLLNHKIDILCATPGRLEHMISRKQLFVTDVRHVVIDEADTLLLDEHFHEKLRPAIEPILKGRTRRITENNAKITDETQFIVVSATFKQQILDKFAGAEKVVEKDVHFPVDKLTQNWIHIKGRDKHSYLFEELQKHKGKRIIVFCNTISSCRSTEHTLKGEGYQTSCYHKLVPPKGRTVEYIKFMKNETNILVCTDIGSRGFDFGVIDHIILFDFPYNVVDYLHRIGRTARAGRGGSVTSFLFKKDRVLAKSIQEGIENGTSLEFCSPSKPLEQISKVFDKRPHENSKRRKYYLEKMKESEPSKSSYYKKKDLNRTAFRK